MLETTRDMLDILGYKVIVAENAETALSVIDGHAVDLAIVDLAMPKVSGLDLGAQLQERQPGLNVLFCSGYPELIAANGKSVNSTLFLKKPFSSRELSTKIESVIRMNTTVAAAVTTPTSD